MFDRLLRDSSRRTETRRLIENHARAKLEQEIQTLKERRTPKSREFGVFDRLHTDSDTRVKSRVRLQRVKDIGEQTPSPRASLDNLRVSVDRLSGSRVDFYKKYEEKRIQREEALHKEIESVRLLRHPRKKIDSERCVRLSTPHRVTSPREPKSLQLVSLRRKP